MFFEKFNDLIVEKLANEIDESAASGFKKGLIFGSLSGAGLGALLAAVSPVKHPALYSLVPIGAISGGLIGGQLGGGIGAIRTALRTGDVGEKPTVRGIISHGLDAVSFPFISIGGLITGLRNGHPIAGTILGTSGAYGAKTKNDDRSRLIKSMVEAGIVGGTLGGLGTLILRRNPVAASIAAPASAISSGLGASLPYLLGLRYGGIEKKKKRK